MNADNQNNAPANIEGNATIAGLRTTYDLRKGFAEQLHELFGKIEDLNRPTPMTEGEYLEFANMVKELSKFSHTFQTSNPVYVALRASVARPERAKPTATIAKAEDTKNYKWCAKCDSFIAKKGWSKHTQTAKCATIHNSKRIASQLTLTKEPEHFNKTTAHPYYKVGQILVADFFNKKAKSEEWVATRLGEWDAVRLNPPSLFSPLSFENVVFDNTPVPEVISLPESERRVIRFEETDPAHENFVANTSPVEEEIIPAIKTKRTRKVSKPKAKKPVPNLVIQDDDSDDEWANNL
jgi:hypothetical protein